MKENLRKIRDARRELLPIFQIIAILSFLAYPMFFIKVFPEKFRTPEILIISSLTIFIALTALWVWSTIKEKTYKPTFWFPIAFLLLVLSTTLISIFVFLFVFELTGSSDFAEFFLKTTLFLLSSLGFWCYRNPEQTQYWIYTIGYGISVLAVWMLESVDVLHYFSDISSAFHDTGALNALEVTINDIAIPIREAMLLFIIWDVYLKAREDIERKKESARKTTPRSKMKPQGHKKKR